MQSFMLKTPSCQELGIKPAGGVFPAGVEDPSVSDLQPTGPGLHPRGGGRIKRKQREQDRMTFSSWFMKKKKKCYSDPCNFTKVSKLLSVTL